MAASPLIIVDAANVIGSTPNGWWRDRLGATRRLRDRLGPLTRHGLSHWPQPPPISVILVTEGAARGLESTDNVTVVDAPGQADDTIVDLVVEHAPTPTVVITSDRHLQHLVTTEGAHTLPVSALKPLK